MLDSSLQPAIAVHGPWGVGDTSGSGLNYKAFQGGALRIPQWFANRFTGGKTLALGFGGYYNIIAGGSLGPALGAIADPVDGQPNVDVITLLGHPIDKTLAPRAADYMSSIDHTPVNGIGVWQWTDTIYGSGAWIDLPTKHGVVYIATQGTGVVQYLHSAVVSDSKKTVAYIYNPADLAAVAQAQKAPWEVVPASYFDFPQVAGTEVDGIAYDATDSTLYLLTVYAYPSGVEIYPVVHAYRVFDSGPGAHGKARRAVTVPARRSR